MAVPTAETREGAAEEALFEFRNMSPSHLISWIQQVFHWNDPRLPVRGGSWEGRQSYLRPTVWTFHTSSQLSQDLAGARKVLAETMPSWGSCPRGCPGWLAAVGKRL